MKLLLLLVLCSCDQLFGFDTVPAPVPDGALDAAPREVTCDYLWHVVTPDAMGTPTVTIEAAPPGYAHVFVGGQELAIGGDGSFSFMAPAGTPYKLELVLPGGTFFFDRDSDSCHLVSRFFQRETGAPAVNSTPLTLSTTTPVAVGTNVLIASTGIRTFSGTTMAGTTWTVDWKNVYSLDGNPAELLDASLGDRLFWEGFAVNSEYQSIAQAAELSVTLTDGQATSASFQPAAVPQRCVQVETHEDALAAELKAASQLANGSVQSSWAITSTPAPDEGVSEHEPLAITTRTDVVDHTAKVSYGNPFVGESDLFQVGIGLSHLLTAPGASNDATIFSTIVVYDRVHADSDATACNASVATALPPVAMVVAPSVAGQPLASDDQSVMIDRSAPVPVHVDVTAGPHDDLEVVLDEVLASAGRTTVVPIALYYPLAQDFTIDPAQLQVGHTYMLDMRGELGQPRALQFDYRATAFPTVESMNPSTTFLVAN